MKPQDMARLLVTPLDLELVRHMLGVATKTPKGYRNYFVAAGDNVAAMERLQIAGLVTKGETDAVGTCYHATLAGAQAVGLTELPK